MFGAQLFVTYLAFVLCTKGVYTEHDLHPRWVNPNDGHSFWGSHRPTAKINPMVKKVENLQLQVDHLEGSVLELTLITANLLKKVKELEIRKPVCNICLADKVTDFPLSPTLTDLHTLQIRPVLPPIPPSLLHSSEFIDFPPDPTLNDLTITRTMDNLPPIPKSWTEPPTLVGFPPNPTVEDLTKRPSISDLPPIPPTIEWPTLYGYPPNPSIEDLTTTNPIASLPPIPASLRDPPSAPGFPPNPTVEGLTTPGSLLGLPEIPRTLLDWPTTFPRDPTIHELTERLIANLLPIPSSLKERPSSVFPPNPKLADLTTEAPYINYPPVEHLLEWPEFPLNPKPENLTEMETIFNLPPAVDANWLDLNWPSNPIWIEGSQPPSALSNRPTQTPQFASSCASALRNGEPDGVYLIEIKPSFKFYAYCLNDPQNNGQAWTLIQRRIDGTMNFYRNWKDFKVGFGHLQGEFFLGMDILHEITMSEPQEIRMELGDWSNNIISIAYDSFAIGNEYEKYRIQVLGNYSGDIDYLRSSAGEKFSTYDRAEDNDSDEHGHCATLFQTAWWHNACNDSSQWKNEEITNTIDCPPTYHGSAFGRPFTNNPKSLKTALMAVRPRQIN